MQYLSALSSDHNIKESVKSDSRPGVGHVSCNEAPQKLMQGQAAGEDGCEDVLVVEQRDELAGQIGRVQIFGSLFSGCSPTRHNGCHRSTFR